MLAANKLIARVSAWVLSVIMICHPLASAEVPKLIRYQGQAVDANGVALEGPYTLTFRLYDVETGGTAVWTETQPDLPVTGGYFTALLGQVTSLAPVDWSQPLWLGVQVGTETEFTPRQPITSVPLAIRAGKAEGLTTPLTTSMITGTFAHTVISPQGSGSNLDADTVDGYPASELVKRSNHTGTQHASTITGTFPPSQLSPQGSSSGLDADTVDGMHAPQLLPKRVTQLYRCPVHLTAESGCVVSGDCTSEVRTVATCTWSRSNPAPRQSTCPNTGTWTETCTPIGHLIE